MFPISMVSLVGRSTETIPFACSDSALTNEYRIVQIASETRAMCRVNRTTQTVSTAASASAGCCVGVCRYSQAGAVAAGLHAVVTLLAC